MKYEVLQRSHYKYSLPVKESINQCLFKPLHTVNQSLLFYEQKIFPYTECYSHLDYWGNEVTTFYIWEPHNELIVETRSILEIVYEEVDIKIDKQIEEEMKTGYFISKHAEFLMPTDYTNLTDKMHYSVVNALKRTDMDVFTFLKKLNSYIYQVFAYEPGATHVKTTAKEAFEKQSGVCQDFSHVMLSICRREGIPARYVSGYIYGGEDAAMRGDSQTHAWIEVYLPKYGWVGFDPTNNCMARNQHIRVATGRDYRDITPLKGVYIGSGRQELDVSISVSRMKDDAKVSC